MSYELLILECGSTKEYYNNKKTFSQYEVVPISHTKIKIFGLPRTLKL